MKEVPFASLVLDFDIYIRDTIDTRIVRGYCKAKSEGAEFPPLIICKKSRRVVDGFKRYRMYKTLKIEMVPVIEKTYRTEAALLADAIRYNASHGQPLDDADRARCVILAGKLGMSDAALAGALGRSTEDIEGLRVTKTASVGRLSVPLKRTIRHMAGKKLTKKQGIVNDKLGGMSVGFYARQLVMLIENDLLDPEDTDGFEQLKRLHELLEGIVVA